MLGIDPTQQDDIADIVTVGEPASAEEIKAAFGVDSLPVTEVTPEVILAFNRPESREVGVPGGGAVMRACDLALYYQALLHDQGEIWKPDVLADVTSERAQPDARALVGHPRQPQPRADPGRRRRLQPHPGPRAAPSPPGAFGHNGAGGQLAWADPATGLSLGYTTNGYDLHVVREPRRGTAISSLAGACVRVGDDVLACRRRQLRRPVDRHVV